MAEVSVTVHDYRIASAPREDVWVGRGFLFLGASAFDAPGLSWIPRLFNAPRAPRVVSLLGPDPVDLLGVSVQPAATPTLDLRSLTCDKAIYREGKDAVRLLALDLLAPSAEATLEVDLNGREFGRYPLALDGRGAALLELRDLPAGDYRARVRGAGGEDCTFTVATYRLAPLVASLVQRRMEGASRLWFRLRLEAYGSPVDGGVTVEISDRGRRLARERFEARGGFVEGSLPLTGEGPHELSVQLVADPSRTASVPVVGSRAFEREQTIFSTLGVEILGALLPGGASRPVRGVYLDEGARRNSPFLLERVDQKTARLRATTDVEAARVVVIDPAFPQPRRDAVDPATARHPSYDDPAYQRGEKLFLQGKYVEAKALFELVFASRPVAHPNYAYYVACCHARLGDLGQAVASLRMAIEHGWRDWAHLAGDDDLASLRGYGPFEALRSGGRREIAVDALRAGGEVVVEGSGPLSLVAVGAVVGGAPWEGFAALIAPEEIEARIVAPEIPTPGSEVRIDVEVGTPDASVYLLVKDARLLSPDTPSNRIASRLKGCVHEAHKQLGGGPVARLLSSMIAPPPPAYPPTYMQGGFGPPPPAMGPPPPPMPGRGRVEAEAPMAAARPSAPAAFGGAPGGRPPAPMSPAPAPGVARPMAPPPPMAAPAPMAPPPPAPGPRGAPDLARKGEGAPRQAEAEAEAARPAAAVTEEPEILFAGLIEARDGQASATVVLGPTAADYVVEAFVLSGLHWKMSEARFRADKTPSIALELPAFVHPSDTAIGRAVLGCASGRMRVRVLRDGADLPLLIEGRPLQAGEEIAKSSAEVSFLASAGDYSALVEDVGTGAADWVGKRVDEPGKFRRVARAVRLLSAGEAAARGGPVLGLKVLPGLERPFTALVSATADYGHACCEQTAAKMLAACAMYVFADHPHARSQAAAIIIAGVRRERSMWLRGRGFKMYPESSNEPNAYWGSKAAMHLWWLASVRDASAGAGRPLLQALDEGLEMAADATRGHGVPWPPSSATTCEEAYRVLRFGADRASHERALSLVRQRASAPLSAQGAVAQRAELSYAAAALLRSRSAADLPLALRLANQITQALGPHGRLYSTVDSAAAIALMGELRAAGVVGAGGAARVNGHPMAIGNAAAFEGEIHEVASLQGVVAVEETRLIEESWSGFQAAVPVRVALERGGRVTRRLSAGDDVALRVTLEGGYKDGDLAWVCLPEALSRVQGGGQVKMFSIDFEGKSEVVVPLAATGVTVGRDGSTAAQHFAVCVRNMFEEERAGNPGLLDVTVEGADGASGLGRLVKGLKSFFGA